MARPGRPSKKSSPHPPLDKVMCLWCREPKSTLLYILPTQNGKKEFCSEICLAGFRRAYSNGACGFCDNVIRGQPIRLETGVKQVKEFCSPDCLAKFQNKHLIPPLISPELGGGMTNSCTSSSNNNIEKESSSPKKLAFKYPCGPTAGNNIPPEGTADFSSSWDKYLEETKAKPAPLNCFKQNLVILTNEFKPGQKLEAQDPRNTTSTCIATVIGTVGPRLKLRLDGSDNSNDFWKLVDSEDIKSVGACEQSGGLLQPPLGFRKNASFWPSFLVKTLTGAERAPEKCFKAPPETPKGNYFRPGMKLEAVDLKNPHLICVATIGEVNGEQIFISFDGWRGAFDFWAKFDSRDIFPVGWCAKNGHQLQAPGQKGPVEVVDGEEEGSKVIFNVNKTCRLGLYLDPQRVSELSSTYGPAPASEMIQHAMQLLLDSAHDPRRVSQFIKQGNGKWLSAGKMRLKLRTIENSQEFWIEIQNFLRRLNCCTRFIYGGPCTGCDEEYAEGRSDLERKRSFDSSFTPEAPVVGKKRVVSGSSSSTTSSHPLELNDGLTITIKSSPTPTPHHIQSSSEFNSSSTSGGGSGICNYNGRSMSSSTGRLDPNEWTVEDVISHIVSADPGMGVHAEVFRKHEIDGKAMVLLNSEVMMKYMGLKLGPALKICNIITKIKSSKRYTNGS